jgi:hypothetical protein
MYMCASVEEAERRVGVLLTISLCHNVIRLLSVIKIVIGVWCVQMILTFRRTVIIHTIIIPGAPQHRTILIIPTAPQHHTILLIMFIRC